MIRFLALLFFPATVFAQTANSGTDAGMASQYASMVPLVFIFLIFYVLLIRPQQKRMKEHQVMLGGLKKGDEVVTGGGIIGKITKAETDTLTVEIAKGVEVSVLKSTVTSIVGNVVVKPTDKKKNDNSALNREKVANDN